MKKITLFSSGDLTEGKRGIYKLLLSYQQRTKEYQETLVETTQNRLQLSALIKGLSLLQEPCEVTVHTDAPYLVKGVTLWLEKWQKRAFSHVVNQDLWQTYVDSSQRHTIHMVLMDQETFDQAYCERKVACKTG